jgi:hypothetical protein
MVKRYLYFTAIGFAFLLGLGTLFVMRTQTGCALVGGRWGSVPGSCFTPLCHDFGDCGRWLNPAVRCETIALGTPYRTLHFYFGEPRTAHGKQFSWRFGKMETWTAEATVVDGKVVRLNCFPDE